MTQPPSPLPVPPPPPLPVGVVSRPASVRVPPKPARARPPGAVWWIGGSAAVLALVGLTCVGLVVFSSSTALRRSASAVQSQLQAKRQAMEVQTDSLAALRDLAAALESIRSVEFEYPLTLPELPPIDPWGQPIVYRRISPDRAELRCLGPDGISGTADDNVLQLPTE